MNVERKCKKCGICCQGKLGACVFPSDVEPIANYLNIHPNDFLNHFCNRYSLTTKHGKVELYCLKIIDRKCIFLQNNLCEVFEGRPFQCKNAPFHFLSYYSLWKHMPCVKEEDFIHIDSSEVDKTMFSQLIEVGYKKFSMGGEEDASTV